MEPTTIAEFWDCEIEHSEVKQRWVNQHLLVVIRRTLGAKVPRNLDVEDQLRKMAENQAVHTERQTNDKVLTFEDGSRLALVDMGAGTMEGSSRVMSPGDRNVREKVRNGKPYRHGITRTAWYWTRNGKTFGKTPPPTATTGEKCPRSGRWVRIICHKGCADNEVPALSFLTQGEPLGRCPTCLSEAVWGWATP